MNRVARRAAAIAWPAFLAAAVLEIAVLAFVDPASLQTLDGDALGWSATTVYSLAFFINSRPGGSAAQFGFVTLFLYGSGLVSSPIAGRLVDRIEPRVRAYLGF